MATTAHNTAFGEGLAQPCSFTGKERDEETGYSYFGARYYDSDLSGLFLSVDPMADKYPSISTYAYCAWNPIRIIDPNGDSVIVCGEQSNEIVKQLQTKNMNVSINQNGYLNVNLVNSDLFALSEEEKTIYDAIISDKINIHVYATSTYVSDDGTHYFILKNGNNKNWMSSLYGGSFCGAYKNSATEKVDAHTLIDFNYMNGLGFDQGVVHEISECYYAGLWVLGGSRDIPEGNIREPNDNLLAAHRRAIPERLDSGRTFTFGPRRGQVKLDRMRRLYEY